MLLSFLFVHFHQRGIFSCGSGTAVERHRVGQGDFYTLYLSLLVYQSTLQHYYLTPQKSILNCVGHYGNVFQRAPCQ